MYQPQIEADIVLYSSAFIPVFQAEIHDKSAAGFSAPSYIVAIIIIMATAAMKTDITESSSDSAHLFSISRIPSLVSDSKWMRSFRILETVSSTASSGSES